MSRINRNWTVLLAGLLVLGILMAMSAVANPDPAVPNSMTVTHDRRTSFPSSQTVVAYAGNVTELEMTHEQLTKGWQGYFGDVTGKVVLDDHLNQSMFTWNLTLAGGEVYATWNATTPTWTDLSCLNAVNATIEATRMNILGSYQDNFTNTFDKATHQGFNVSSKGFEPDLCDYSLTTYVNDSNPVADVFNETVLWDETSNFTVYMTLLNEDVYGFNSTKWDFQMLVPEDGWNDNTVSTAYYFYIELE